MNNREIYEKMRADYEQELENFQRKVAEIKSNFDGEDLERAMRELLATKENIALLLRLF